MKTLSIGNSGLTGSSLAYGCWRLAGTWDPSQITPELEHIGRTAVRTAYDCGFRTFDLADIYCHGHAERIFGLALRDNPAMRNDIVVITKCGILPPDNAANTVSPYRYDFSREHILRSCEASLDRIGMETIDLFLLHRPDYLMEPEEVAGAFDSLKSDGKVKEFGVSNFSPSRVTALQKACPMPLIVNQVEISLTNIERFEDGTLDQCLTESMTPMAWSPLGGGRLLRDDQGNPSAKTSDHIGELRKALNVLAEQYGSTPANVALAWLLRHPAGIQPIVGSVNPDHIRQLAQADSLTLSREEWYFLFERARGQRLP